MKTLPILLTASALFLAGCQTEAPRPPAAEESTGRQAAWVQEFLRAHLRSARPAHGGVIFSSDGQLGTYTDDAGTDAQPAWILPAGGHFNSKVGLNPALEFTILAVSEQEATLAYVWSSVDDSTGKEALTVDQGKIKLTFFGPKQP